MKIKIQLTVMQFLQFAVLGCYIISLGGYLASKGLGAHIGMVYAVGGFVSLFMPPLLGALADRYISSQRLYGWIHIALAAALVGFAQFCRTSLSEGTIVVCMILFGLVQALYLPTIPLSYSITFDVFRQQKLSAAAHFTFIRIFGTIGFIVTMVLVDVLGLQHSHGQFYMAAVLSLALAVLSYFLPDCPPYRNASVMKRGAFLKLFKSKELVVFYLFVLCTGIAAKVSDAYVNPFFTDMSLSHANSLVSLSRVSEAVCMLLLPLCLRKMGMKPVFLSALVAWMVYYGALSLGFVLDAWVLFVVSMLSYGVSFNCSSMAGSIYIDNTVPAGMRSTAQGLMTTLTNGVGSLVGTAAAQPLFNHYVFNSPSHNWAMPWLVLVAFCAIATLVVAVLFHPSSRA